MELTIYALTTAQGTAARATMLCCDDLRVVPALLLALDGAGQDVDLDGATFEDITANAEASCRWCGRDAYGEVS